MIGAATQPVAGLHKGRAWPLGAHWDGGGVNFAVFSAHAQRIELCLFDARGEHELQRITLPGHTRDIWHGYLPGAAPGLVYGLRAQGPWRPDHGHRFNPNKLLLDPWAREIVGRFEWRDDQLGADPDDPARPDPRDNAAHALKARVVDDDPDWVDDAPPQRPPSETVLYELHVKGFTRLHPGIPEPLRGTYAGLAHPAVLAHLKRLGITAVSLLPVHQHLDERHLADRGLVNYWGYNTLGFFCPEPRYAAATDAGAVRDEFRAMVRALHRAGIEVILDVVFNHTCESDQTGPTLSWRGLDNASWYRLPHERPDTYINDTGCGNTLDLCQPRVLQFVMDSLRYWVHDMHVDGFRFDLASVLGRAEHGFDSRGAFFKAIAQDPVLAGVKLIAEPWDLGPGGYQLGCFPPGWFEWNDRFRDTMRRWWLHGGVARGEFAQRLCASSDVFHHRHRPPSDSINYVVSHDGFTLRDLLSYRHRHNEANGENNRDGHAHNLSCNHGVEGDTDQAPVLALRARLGRALLATVLLAQGTPMLAAGDELGHTQHGNNNPYNQDNPTTWIDWRQADQTLIDFTARLVRLRREWHPLGERWYSGQPEADGRRDLAWLNEAGQPLEGDAWQRPDGRCLGALIALPAGAPAGRPGSLLMLLNGDADEHAFQLPPGDWQVLLDSTRPDGCPAVMRPAAADPADAPVLAAAMPAAAASAAADSAAADSAATDSDPPGCVPPDARSGVSLRLPAQSLLLLVDGVAAGWPAFAAREMG